MATEPPNNNNNRHDDDDDNQPLSSSCNAAAVVVDGSAEDSALSRSQFLTRPEVLKRRSRRLKQLSNIYRDYYWSLIEELKLKYRDYVWHFGISPHFHHHHHLDKEDHQEQEEQHEEQYDDDNNNYNYYTSTQLLVGGGGGAKINNSYHRKNKSGRNKQCEVHSCKKAAMALTRFCHSHILSDANQVLYKGCKYPTKSSPSGPTLCMKPILKSAVPCLCSNHLEKAEKHMTRALRKEGSIGSSTCKHPLELNVIVAEFVRQIQSNRKAAVSNTSSGI